MKTALYNSLIQKQIIWCLSVGKKIIHSHSRYLYTHTLAQRPLSQVSWKLQFSVVPFVVIIVIITVKGHFNIFKVFYIDIRHPNYNSSTPFNQTLPSQTHFQEKHTLINIKKNISYKTMLIPFYIRFFNRR